MRHRVLLLACLTALALPATAQGGTASVLSNDDPGSPEARAVYRAAPGELNRVTVTIVDLDGDFEVTFEDTGAPVEPGDGCVAQGPNAVRCTEVGLDRADVKLRDGDDTLSAKSAGGQYYFELHGIGGSGADTLTGSPYRDEYQGGAGEDAIFGHDGGDRLAGGTGSDSLDGGRGEDALTGEYYRHTAPPASDRLEGGGDASDEIGGDTVYYYGGSAPVDIDLARAGGNGVAGEDDRLSGIEGAWLLGGTGTLAGDEGPNDLRVRRPARGAVLLGRGGSDILHGSDDPDTIYGGRGGDFLRGGGGMGDRLYAGAGRDSMFVGTLFGGTGWSRAVHCGPGVDLVHSSRRHDILATDCEQSSTNVRLGLSPDLRVVGGNRAVELSLRRRGPHVRCRYAVRLRAPFPQRADARPREVGRLAFRLDRRTWRRIRIELNDYGRRLLTRERPVPVWVQPGEFWRCRPGDRPRFGSDGFTALL